MTSDVAKTPQVTLTSLTENAFVSQLHISNYDPSVNNITQITEQMELAKQTLTDWIRNKRPSEPTRQLIMDLSEITRSTRDLLPMLVNIRSGLRTYGDDMILVGIQPEIAQMLQVTKLDRFFHIRPSAAAILNAGASAQTGAAR